MSIPSSLAQDSGSDGTTLRADRPALSVTVHDNGGAPISSAGTVKLYRETTLFDETGLSHGRAFFASLPFGSYTLVVEATGYKSAQRDLNVSVAMRYEIEANLQREGASNAAEGPAKPMLAPKAKEALDKGLKALSKNKLSEAEKYVSEAAGLAPGHPDVLYLQGILFLKQQNWVQAESALEKASQMDPANGRALSALGMAFVDQGNYDAAIAPLEKSVQLNSGTWETEWALGKAYYQRQQYDQALKASQQAWRDSKGQAPEIELLLAKSLTAVGNYEDSAQALRDFLKRYGDRPEAPTARRYLNRLASDGKIHSN
ncbi:MAG TPA: tetratricopeptide repeat protein [Candidatus Sulfotelmatobacter sp.]|nr:tetratricopeptide repeat protein [Candidatus Sulfotelmatobacter sp.]